jgi:hypothetical protein
VPFIEHSAKALLSVRVGTRQRKVAMTAFVAMTALCRAPSGWRSAKTGPLPRPVTWPSAKGLVFAERPQFGARQRLALCRVPVTWHSAKGSLCRAPNGGRLAKFRSLCRVPVTWHSAKFRSLCRVLFLYTRQRLFLKDFNLFFPHHFTQAHIHTGILFKISHTQPNSRKTYGHNQI